MDMAAVIAFMEARLGEEEAEVKGVPGWKLEHWTAVRYADEDSGRNWRVDAEPRCVVDGAAGEDAQFIARHDPARTLREIEAKRRILERHRGCGDGFGYCADGGHDWDDGGCAELADAVSVWSDHPAG
jgi:hypothetical protein